MGFTAWVQLPAPDAPPPPAPPAPYPAGPVFRRLDGTPVDFTTWVRLHPSERAPAPVAMPQGPDPINPPEAPPDSADPNPVVPAKKAAAVIVPPGGYEAMERDSLKKLAIERGLVTSACREQAPALIKRLRAADVAIQAADPVALDAALAGDVGEPAPDAPGIDMFPATDAEQSAEDRAADASIGEAFAATIATLDTAQGAAARAMIRAVLDRMNATRREMETLEERLHALLGVAS
jgi:hypothetical protein